MSSPLNHRRFQLSHRSAMVEPGFAVRRPGIPWPFPRSDRPSGGRPELRTHVSCGVGDVACGIDIRVVGVSTGAAPEGGLALARRPVRDPAGRAALRGERRIHPDDPSGGLVFQPAHEQAPGVGEDLPVQARLRGDATPWPILGATRRSGHPPDLEILDSDQIEAAGKIRAGLLRPVLPGIGLAGTQPCQRGLQSHPPAGTLAGSGQTTLEQTSSPKPSGGRAWNMQQLAVGKGCRHGDASINTDSTSVVWSGNRWRDGGEGHMPATGPVLGDTIGLHPGWNRARQAEADPTRLGDPYLCPAVRHPANLVGFDPDLPESLVTSLNAPGGTAVSSGETAGHRLGEVAQCLLLDGLRARTQPGEFLSSFGELPCLLHVRRCRTAPPAPPGVLLDGQVPDEPGMRAVSEQHTLLLRRWEQPVATHQSQNVAVGCDRTARPRTAVAARPPYRAREETR